MVQAYKRYIMTREMNNSRSELIIETTKSETEVKSTPRHKDTSYRR